MRVLVLVALALSGCGLTPTQQKWAGVAAGVLIVGAIVAHEQDSGKVVTPNVSTPGVDCAQKPELCR